MNKILNLVEEFLQAREDLDDLEPEILSNKIHYILATEIAKCYYTFAHRVFAHYGTPSVMMKAHCELYLKETNLFTDTQISNALYVAEKKFKL